MRWRLGSQGCLGTVFVLAIVIYYSIFLSIRHPLQQEGREIITFGDISVQWTKLAASKFLSRGKNTKERITLQELNIQPFDAQESINAWDVYPPDISCPDIRRVGRIGDGIILYGICIIILNFNYIGGKFICGLDWLENKRDKCVVYSYGVSTDSTFESDLYSLTGCEIHAFDPTVGGLGLLTDTHISQNISFHKLALGVKSGVSEIFPVVEYLEDTMYRLNHTYIDILKIDIEGAEWEVLKSILRRQSSSDTPLFGQLLIELHFKSAPDLDDFFTLMHESGYVSFSREINLIPCMKGGLPLATEYSFIHPRAYFSEIKKNPQNFLITKEWHDDINGVIYILTHNKRVSNVTDTLELLYINFWKSFPHYPVVIFHDNLDKVHQTKIQLAVRDMKLTFVEIKFKLPKKFRETSNDNTSSSVIPDRTVCSYLSSTIGYRHMIRFHATIAYKQLLKLKFENGRPLQYIWRLDDDSFITHPIGYDIFRFMKSNDIKYGFVNIVTDDPKCVEGMWEHAKQFFNTTRNEIMKEMNPSNRDLFGYAVNESSFFDEIPEGRTFYNNFEISSVDLWASPIWKAYMKSIDDIGNIFYLRWGDAPIHTIGVSMLIPKKNIHKFSDIGYRHLPFVNQQPTGLPKRNMDPLRDEDFVCVYYDQWVCTKVSLSNGTNASVASNYAGINIPEWATEDKIQDSINTIVPVLAKQVETTVKILPKGVLYTFADTGSEVFVQESILSFYQNYAAEYASPFVVFYDKHADRKFNVSAIKSTLSQQAYINVNFIGIDLENIDHKLECTKNTSLLSRFICFSNPNFGNLANFSASPPPNDCNGDMNEKTIYLKKISSFLMYRAINILSSLSYEWFWRFGLSSRLKHRVNYNIFTKMANSQKRYGFISAIRENEHCISDLWKAAINLCLSRGNSGDCSGLIKKWSPGVVFFTNFEISHHSVWDSKLFIDFLVMAHTIQNGMKFSQVNSERSILFCNDATIHSLAILLSLTTQEILKINDIKYSVDSSPWNRTQSKHLERVIDYKRIKKELTLDSLFSSRRFGWLGGDVASSFLLPSCKSWTKLGFFRSNAECLSIDSHLSFTEQYVWLFGDSIIGTSTSTKRLSGVMTSNTVAIAEISFLRPQSAGSIEKLRFFWGSDSHGLPGPIFTGIFQNKSDDEENIVFWPLSGLIATHENSFSGSKSAFTTSRAVILGQLITHDISDIAQSASETPEVSSLLGTFDNSQMNFKIIDSVLSIVRNPYASPDMWSYDWIRFPKPIQAVRNSQSLTNNALVAYQWFCIFSQSIGVSVALGPVYIYFIGVFSIHRETDNVIIKKFRSSVHDIFSVSTLKYNVLGRISTNDLINGNFDKFQVLGSSKLTTPELSGKSSWYNIYSQENDLKSLIPTRCFGFAGVASEGSLDYFEDQKLWIFVTLIMLENQIHLCTKKDAYDINDCNWRCDILDGVNKDLMDTNKFITYAAKLHREVALTSAPDTDVIQIVISYLSNVVSGPGDLFLEENYGLYTPRFISLNISAS